MNQRECPYLLQKLGDALVMVISCRAKVKRLKPQAKDLHDFRHMCVSRPMGIVGTCERPSCLPLLQPSFPSPR